jgi:hypothetical protein
MAALLALAASGCAPPGLSHAQAVEAAVRHAPPSAVPIAVESVQDGPFQRFVPNQVGDDATRHVWAISLVGAFEGEGVAGNVPHYGHELVVLDFATGEFIAGVGSS